MVRQSILNSYILFIILDGTFFHLIYIVNDISFTALLVNSFLHISLSLTPSSQIEFTSIPTISEVLLLEKSALPVPLLFYDHYFGHRISKRNMINAIIAWLNGRSLQHLRRRSEQSFVGRSWYDPPAAAQGMAVMQQRKEAWSIWDNSIAHLRGTSQCAGGIQVVSIMESVRDFNRRWKTASIGKYHNTSSVHPHGVCLLVRFPSLLT